MLLNKIFLSRLLKQWNPILKDLLALTGLVETVNGILNYFSIEVIPQYRKTPKVFIFYLIVIIIIAIIKNKPKSSFQHKLRDKDTYIEIKVGDAFTNSGALIIPINDHYDVSLNGNVKTSRSMQSKLIAKYYDSKDEHLKNDIEAKLQHRNKHDIGTVIEIEQKGKKFYLLANSTKKENNHVISTLDDFMISLNKLWDHLAHESSKESVITIPLINTGNGRVPHLNRETAIKQIVNTFIEASKHKVICEKLIISIYPSDVIKGQIDLDKLNEFLKFSCNHYTEVKFEQKSEGLEISSSQIAYIGS